MKSFFIFVRPLQKVDEKQLKKMHPLFPDRAGISPTTKTNVISLQE